MDRSKDTKRKSGHGSACGPRYGRNVLMTPGPTNLPDRVLAAMNRPAVDLLDPEFVALAESTIEDMKRIFKTESHIFMYAANGHGAWEAALSNLIGIGDRLLVPHTGVFSKAWAEMARRLGAEIEEIAGDGRSAIDLDAVEKRLRADRERHDPIRAVLAVQTDTATSVTSDIAALRQTIDAAGHPALLLVDVVASLCTVDFRMDEWGVDVAIAGSQKGLMAPPGLAFTAVGERAIEVGGRSDAPRRAYWDWQVRTGDEFYMKFCGTPPEHLIWGLREGLNILFEEGLDGVFARHLRMARAVHGAVERWASSGSIELNVPLPHQRSNAVTTIRIDPDFDIDRIRQWVRDGPGVSLGSGLGPLEGRAFRIGHMGWVNEAMLLGALGSIELAFQHFDVPYGKGGVEAAIDSLGFDLR
ncbi:pyridoxal-phosphate-dependent aminotransferase family protein [Thioalkalivibrio sp. HK1]|uniref:pyridoxal-phosphate-dependent aminotransferase family protein n=1 Tax=Thioalkalivibrio sp. HK1 TaxID=1469245 RepID=UPI0004B4DAAF|nr:aminotransferase class V-fold PLP-dependent enzyme [Thioalkalivibrio sp. HK1]